MKEWIRKAGMATSFTALMMMILGILLIVNPGAAVLTVCRIVGCIMLIAGAVLLIYFLVKRSVDTDNGANFLICILAAVLLAVGLFVVIRPDTVVGFVGILFAIILFLRALGTVNELKQLKQVGDDRWWLSLITILATALMGVVVLIAPFGSASVMMILTGVFMLISGIAALYLELRLILLGKQVHDKLEEKRPIDVDAREIDE